MLCTLDQVKIRLNIKDSDVVDDPILTNAIANFSARFDAYCNRIFARTANAEEEFSGDDTEIRVGCYPIEEVSSFQLKSTETAGWEDQTDADYIIRRACVISLTGPLGTYRQQGKVIYTGGYVLPGDTAAEGQEELPDDIREACIEQVAAWYRDRHRQGLTSVSGDGGSVSQTVNEFALLPSVLATLSTKVRFLN